MKNHANTLVNGMVIGGLVHLHAWAVTNAVEAKFGPMGPTTSTGVYAAATFVPLAAMCAGIKAANPNT